MRKIANVDANQTEIVNALRRIGCTVTHLHQLGGGVPDLLVGFRGFNYLLEVKDGAKPPSKQRLTKDERAYHESWQGQVAIVNCIEAAIEAVGGYGYRKKRSDQVR